MLKRKQKLEMQGMRSRFHKL